MGIQPPEDLGKSWYFLTPEIRADQIIMASAERFLSARRLFLAVGLNGDLFVWNAAGMKSGLRKDTDLIIDEIVAKARKHPHQIFWGKKSGKWEATASPEATVLPTMPHDLESMADVVRIGMSEYIVSSPDHPAIRQVMGML